RLKKLLANRDDVPQTRGLLWSAELWHMQRSLFGVKRHPLLAGVQENINNLLDLGVPCRLIYARTRGGRVNDPILHQHPGSTGRRNDIEPPAEMPDLSPADLRPMDGRWICGFQTWGSVSPYCIFRGWTDEAHALFPRYPEGLVVVGDDFEPLRPIWVPKRL